MNKMSLKNASTMLRMAKYARNFSVSSRILSAKMKADFVKVTTPNGLTYEQPTGLFINNEFVKSHNGATIAVEDPATEKKIVEVQSGTKEDVEYAVECAEKAFNSSWSTGDPRVRARALLKLADLIEQRKELISSIECMDNGKALFLAKNDVRIVIDYIRSSAGFADKLA